MAASQHQVLTDSSPKEIKAHTYLLECEQVIAQTNDQRHEGQISFTHGFVPYTPLKDELPPEFKAWDVLGENLSSYLCEVTERAKIRELPELDPTPEALPDIYLMRASTILGNAAHAYYYNERLGFDQEADPLPLNLRRPWEQINARLNRRLPGYKEGKLKAIRGSYEAFFAQVKLNNPALADGVHNGQITMDDLSLHMPLFNNNEERVFVLTIMLMELRFAPALKAIISAIRAVKEQDDKALVEALKTVTTVIDSVTDALGYLTANEHSKHYVDPMIWPKTIATFDGEIPGGLRGLSASVFPLFHVLDRLFERTCFDSVLGKAIVEKYESQPRHVYDFLTALSKDLCRFSLSGYIKQSKNSLLQSQYQAMMDAYVGERGLTNRHSCIAYVYLKMNFRSGRLETNGLQRGTATVETEEQRTTIKNFTAADLERKKGYIPKPKYATKVSVRTLSGTASEVVLDVSQTGLTFTPGDHCAVLPVNTDSEIQELARKHQINTDLEVKLNDEWKHFFFTQLGLDVAAVKVTELLRYVDIKRSSLSDKMDMDSLHPLCSRLYSVSPLTKALGHIRLTVGRHSYEAEESKSAGFVGKASEYLVHTTSVVHVERAPARQFYLPENPETPILMFAAGTGISPFMGFIEARAQSGKGLNWLFMSTRHHASLYYVDELQKTVANGQLKLSVIFSREDKNSVEFDQERKAFSFKKKYAGKHVDELIKENSREIAKLILAGAHVYVCGNNEFAATVRGSIQTALLANDSTLSEEQCKRMINRLIADHFYHYDAYTPAGSEQSKSTKSIYRSEVAYHNKLGDCWVIINGCVYDLSSFIDVHPGGRKILQINGGMDASGDYNFVKHNASQQIEAILLQNKVGVLATVRFPEEKLAATYNKCIKFLEALLEMANTLSNSTTFITKTPVYVGREVFNIFVNGHLNNYESKGSIGSLKYTLGTLLSEFNEALGVPKDHYKMQLEEIFNLASQCAHIIRTSLLASSPETHAEVERIKNSLLQQTLTFIEKMKLAVILFANELERLTDNPDKTPKLVREIEKNLVNYLEALNQARTSLAVFEKRSRPSSMPHPGLSLDGGVCPMGFGEKKATPVRSSEVGSTLFASSAKQSNRRLGRGLLAFSGGLVGGMLATGPLAFIVVIGGAACGYKAPDIVDAMTKGCRKRKSA